MKEINLLGNDALIKQFGKYQLIGYLVFGFIFSIVAYVIDTPNIITSTILEIIIAVAVIVLAFVLHEGIHGLFFKAFSPKTKVYFGMHSGMLYCAIPGARFTPRQFIIGCIAPFIFVTAALVIIFLIGILSPLSFTVIASIHAAGCIGDFYWIMKMLQTSNDATIETTERGIIIYDAEI